MDIAQLPGKVSKLLPISSLLLFMLSACISKPGSFWGSLNAYLGQAPPNDTTKVFDPGLLTDTSGMVLDRVAFSPDRKEFYFCHSTSWFSLTNLRFRVLSLQATAGKDSFF